MHARTGLAAVCTLLSKWGTMVSMKRCVAGLSGSNSSAFSAVTIALHSRAGQ